MTPKNIFLTALVAIQITGQFFFLPNALAHDTYPDEELIEHEQALLEQIEDDYELLPDFVAPRSCARATGAQVSVVNSGNQQYNDFINDCVNSTGSTNWCSQIVRPNPSSKSTFACTYGVSQPHQLIHPGSATWKNAIATISLIQKLSSQGICVSQIYNWWRPEPYNANVGGAPGRHPFGTSVDVRFCSNSDAIKGFDKLCSYRKQGYLRALGYYGGSGVHIGIGDSTANTWGRGCP